MATENRTQDTGHVSISGPQPICAKSRALSAKAERIEDPTRTTSRNHAAISIDTDGALWIEDYGSLNGTYIITNGQETQVTKGTPLKLSAPATVRIGDQFFQFSEKQA